MSAPVLLLLAGPNGSGKSTLAHEVLCPITGLPFVNADEIAHDHWPGDEERHAYEASKAAAAAREALLDQRRSFISETVFSHPSKLELVRRAIHAGYIVELHVVLLSLDVTLERVRHRVEVGGHAVPPEKVRERYERLWPLIAQARAAATSTTFYDNSVASSSFRTIARYRGPTLLGQADWPSWTPAVLIASDLPVDSRRTEAPPT